MKQGPACADWGFEGDALLPGTSPLESLEHAGIVAYWFTSFGKDAGRTGLVNFDAVHEPLRVISQSKGEHIIPVRSMAPYKDLGHRQVVPVHISPVSPGNISTCASCDCGYDRGDCPDDNPQLGGFNHLASCSIQGDAGPLFAAAVPHTLILSIQGGIQDLEIDIDGYRRGTVAKAGQEAREPFLAEDVTHEAPGTSEKPQC